MKHLPLSADLKTCLYCMTSRNVTGTVTCRVGVTLLSHSSADGKLNSPAMLRWLRGKENTLQDGFNPCLHPHPSLVDEGLILSPFVSIQPSKDKPTFETSSLLPCWLRNYFSTSFGNRRSNCLVRPVHAPALRSPILLRWFANSNKYHVFFFKRNKLLN